MTTGTMRKIPTPGTITTAKDIRQTPTWKYAGGMAHTGHWVDPVYRMLSEAIQSHDSSMYRLPFLWSVDKLLDKLGKRKMRRSEYEALLDGTHQLSAEMQNPEIPNRAKLLRELRGYQP